MLGFLSFLLVIAMLTAVVAIAVLYSRVNQLERDLRRLSQSLPDLITGMMRGPGAVPKDEAPARAAAPPVIHPRPQSAAKPTPASIHSAPTIIATQQFEAIASSPPRSRTKEEWEALIGGKLLNRIGALALIIGMGFFLKYAFDNNWINEATRVIIGAAMGGLLLWGAARTHARGFAIFAQGLVGSGIAVLYLSVYASFNFYHLVPQIAAFALMTVVTGIAFANAFKYDSLAVALLAWFGGFLTPFLLGTGESDELGLFTYVALLDAGILIISLRKTAWTVLEPLALGGTWLVYAFWYSSDFTPDKLPLTLYFVAIFWGLFAVLSTGKVLRGEQSFKQLRMLAATANALLPYIALYNLLEPESHDWTGGATLVLAVVYGLSAMLLRRRTPHESGWIALLSTAAASFVVIATAVQFTGYTTIGVWAVEALVLAWLGARHTRPHFSWLAFGLFAAAGFKLLVTPGAVVPAAEETFLPFLSQRALTYAVLAASGWIASTMFSHLAGGAASLIENLLSYCAALAVFLLFTVETSAYFARLTRAAPPGAEAGIAFHRWMALSAAWSVIGTVMTWIGVGRSDRPLFVAGLVSLLIGICAAAVRGIAFDPVADFSLLFNWRFAALTCVVVLGFVVVFRLDRGRGDLPWREEIFGVLRMILVVLALILVTGETRDYFERALADLKGFGSDASAEVRGLENLKQLSLSTLWLISSILLIIAGILRHTRALRVAAIALFGFTILKIFIYDLSFLDTLYRIFSFIGLGVILLAVSYAYQRYKGLIFRSEADSVHTPPGPP